jgi:protein-S-isoprenylcysteine O-methyltransferase Ste14
MVSWFISEQAYRLTVLAGLLSFAPVGIHFRLRSARTREPLDRTREGWALLISLRLAGLLMFVSTVCYILRPGLVGWAQVSLPPLVRWSGVPFGAFGALLFVATLRALGPNLTDTVVTRREHSLVTHGPYRWVRHPFYLSALSGGVGTALLSANLVIFAATVSVYALLVIRTPIEERHLADRFGKEYEEYRRRVGAFLPRGWPTS